MRNFKKIVWAKGLIFMKIFKTAPRIVATVDSTRNLKIKVGIEKKATKQG